MKISNLAGYMGKEMTKRGWNLEDMDREAKWPAKTAGQLACGAKLFSDKRIKQLAAALGLAEEELLIQSGVWKSPERRLAEAELDELSQDELLEATLLLRDLKRGKKLTDDASP